MIAFIKRIMAAVRRRQRYLKRWQRDLTGKNRIPKTKIGTLDSAKIKAEKSKTIRVVYLFGMPRTGSTLMKHHLGGGAQFALHPFSASYYDAWVFSKQNSKGQIVIDKRTENIRFIDEIWHTFGTECAMAGIVRDPRDQMVSLMEFSGHGYIPRDESFWDEWVSRYANFLALAMRNFMYGRFYLLRYEDLVRYPQEARAEYLAWLGLPPDAEDQSGSYSTANTQFAEMLRESGIRPDSEEAFRLGEQAKLREDFKFHARPEIHTESIGRWKTIEDNQQREIIEAYKNNEQARKLMRLLGYSDEVQPITAKIPGCQVFAPEDK